MGLPCLKGGTNLTMGRVEEGGGTEFCDFVINNLIHEKSTVYKQRWSPIHEKAISRGGHQYTRSL